MKNWYDVIHQSDVDSQRSIYILDEKTMQQPEKKIVTQPRVVPPRRQYWLGKCYPSLYLTQREAECMFYLSRGLTIAATADKLDLSARTVEFYLKKVKEKMKIRKKSQLLQRLHEIGYIDQLVSQLIFT